MTHYISENNFPVEVMNLKYSLFIIIIFFSKLKVSSLLYLQIPKDQENKIDHKREIEKIYVCGQL